MKPFIAVCLAAATLVAQTPERKSITPIGSFHDFRADSAKADGETIHYLALEASAAALQDAKAAGRVYSADERLADPTGFYFAAANNNGVYELGDHAPMLARTRLTAQTPVPAKLRILRGEEKVAEADASEITYAATEPGAYRFEARVGEGKMWIRTEPIFLEKANGIGVTLPPGDVAPTVEVKKDIAYVDGKEADANKHKLDLYLPKGKRAFPVLVFLHGGSWRSGDRAMYPALGNRFAKEGIGVVVPSYRLMPGAPHPAQVEDVAAAVEWVLRNIAEYGGDTKRIYVSGHSAGGHLAAWVGLDPRFRHKLKGVIAISGVYDVSTLAAFRSSDVDASPIHRITMWAPTFLITYCQNDYPTLAREARTFHAALRTARVRSDLLYVPGKNHISEIADVWREDDPTAQAVLRVVRASRNQAEGSPPALECVRLVKSSEDAPAFFRKIAGRSRQERRQCLDELLQSLMPEPEFSTRDFVTTLSTDWSRLAPGDGPLSDQMTSRILLNRQVAEAVGGFSREIDDPGALWPLVRCLEHPYLEVSRKCEDALVTLTRHTYGWRFFYDQPPSPTEEARRAFVADWHAWMEQMSGGHPIFDERLAAVCRKAHGELWRALSVTLDGANGYMKGGAAGAEAALDQQGNETIFRYGVGATITANWSRRDLRWIGYRLFRPGLPRLRSAPGVSSVGLLGEPPVPPENVYREKFAALDLELEVTIDTNSARLRGECFEAVHNAMTILREANEASSSHSSSNRP